MGKLNPVVTQMALVKTTCVTKPTQKSGKRPAGKGRVGKMRKLRRECTVCPKFSKNKLNYMIVMMMIMMVVVVVVAVACVCVCYLFLPAMLSGNRTIKAFQVSKSKIPKTLFSLKNI